MSVKPAALIFLGTVVLVGGYLAWDHQTNAPTRETSRHPGSAMASSSGASGTSSEPTLIRSRTSMTAEARSLSPEQLENLQKSDVFYQSAQADVPARRIATEEITLPDPKGLRTGGAAKGRAVGYVLPSRPTTGSVVAAVPGRPGQDSVKPATVPPNEAIKKPVVLETWEPESLGLSPAQQQMIENLRTDFIQDIGGPGQEATDPEYAQRWIQAQSKSDRRVRAMLGTHIADMMQVEAARAAFAAKNPEAPENR